MTTTNITANKLLAHISRIANDHRPITADLFITNYCNNKCPYCTYKRWDLGEKAYAMPFDLFVQVARRLLQLGVLGIIITGGGEPTLNPDFIKITDWLSENKIRFGMNTNFNKLRLCKPEFLKVSLDGHDAESYLNNRGVDAYDITIENVKTYASWKRKNSPKTSLGIQCIPRSAQDVKLFWEAHKTLDVDYMVFRPIESTRGEYYNTCSDDVASIVQSIDELNRIDPRCVKNCKWEMLGLQEKECSAQWAQIAVDERGNVMYCCHKPYQIVGNIFDQNILDLKAAAKTDMSSCDIPCRLTTSNKIISELSKPQYNEVFI